MLLTLVMAVALCQAPPSERPTRSDRAGLSIGELVNMLDTYAIVRAQEALQLPDAQYGSFVTRLKQLQQVRRRNTQARQKIVQDLRRLAQESAPDDATLK